jgi:hypothetical protein
MDRVFAVILSPAAPIAVIAAVAWAPATGFPTWPAVSRGRFAGTAAVSAVMASVAFIVVGRLTALGGG